MPAPPLPPAVLISALFMAWDSWRALLVKSCSRSTFTSNESRNAWSFCLQHALKKLAARLLLQRQHVASGCPTCRAESPASAADAFPPTKLFSVCGTLSSETDQSSLVRCGTRLPDLFLTVKNRSTRFTLQLQRGHRTLLPAAEAEQCSPEERRAKEQAVPRPRGKTAAGQSEEATRVRETRMRITLLDVKTGPKESIA